MPRKPTTRDTFPTADDYAAACTRAETILAHYQKARGDRRGAFYGDAAALSLIVRAIADLTILAQAEYAVACGEAAAERENPPANGGAEYVTDEGLSLALALLEHTRRLSADSGLAGDGPPASIF
jgi:hypothetical protein